MIWNLIGTIGGKVLDIVDDVIEEKMELDKKLTMSRQTGYFQMIEIMLNKVK